MGVADLLPSFADGELAGKSITFIPTACAPERVKSHVKSGKKALQKLGLAVDVLELTTASVDAISSTLRKNDFIYISGGNTFFLLQELRRMGADKLVAEQIEAGKLYVGESAGAVILSPNIDYAQYYDDPAKAPDLTDCAGLGIVDFYPCPHYTNFPFRGAVNTLIAQYKTERPLNPISNSQAILVSNTDVRVVAS
jgi:dipeptidase E